MKKHWSYLRYVVRHKFWVFVAGINRGVPLGQLLLHDWSKFLPGEWNPYSEFFYGYNGESWGKAHVLTPGRSERYQAFMQAFNQHLHRSPHHWQFWILTPDSQNKPEQVFEMPERYAREMLADWDGAGRAITGKWGTPSWYLHQGPKDRLHPNTRAFVEYHLGLAK